MSEHGFGCAACGHTQDTMDRCCEQCGDPRIAMISVLELFGDWRAIIRESKESSAPKDAGGDNELTIEYHLNEIDAWRSGQRGTPGCPAPGSRYPLRMMEAISRHEQALIDLGHQPTVEYVRARGHVDGTRGK
jgi:hypothetical protein